jgi:hypothetical protein
MLEKLAAVENPTPKQLAVGEILVTLIEQYEQRGNGRGDLNPWRNQRFEP